MNRMLRRALLGAAGVALGGVLIWLSYMPGGLLWLELLVESPQALSGLLFWTGAIVIGFSLGGWEFLLIPLKILHEFESAKASSKLEDQLSGEDYVFQLRERFSVDEQYFESIGDELPHPEYRSRRPKKTLDNVPDYKQEIELPNYAERAENSPYAEMEMGNSDEESRPPARDGD